MLAVPPWNEQATQTTWILGLFLLGYAAYYLFAESDYWRNYFSPHRGGPARHMLWSRYLGGLLIGVLPALILQLCTPHTLTEFGLKASFDLTSLWWILGLAFIIVPINYFNTRNDKHLAQYPTVRRQEWTWLQMIDYAGSWVVYLFGYELMFRGILLFGLLSVLGVWPTIILNVVLYVLVHLPKSMAESIGALPLGLLLCLITLSIGTIWVALVVHITLALSNFLFSFYHHPEMRRV
ncbi:MAG: CPBP family intramembrane metalloprotease [Bacteroidetes bacterium]|nr:MAG: CPBP family intramembrane metalloprotease [Bacteroidota bacterium]